MSNLSTKLEAAIRSPTTKVRKATQNVETRVVWGN